MKKIYWIGGSWPNGCELEYYKQTANPQRECAYPTLISNAIGAECINLSEDGSSIDTILVKFSNIVNELDETSVVLFELQPIHRVSFFDNDDKLKNILPSGYKIAHNLHNYSEKWYKYFDTPKQQLFNHDRNINLLHLWCTHLNIKHYFLNTIGSHTESMMDITPDSAWLIPKLNCLAEIILPVTDKITREVVYNDSPSLTDVEWSIQKPFVEKYIHPCYVHPNVEGHKKIAKTLSELLKNA